MRKEVWQFFWKFNELHRLFSSAYWHNQTGSGQNSLVSYCFFSGFSNLIFMLVICAREFDSSQFLCWGDIHKSRQQREGLWDKMRRWLSEEGKTACSGSLDFDIHSNLPFLLMIVEFSGQRIKRLLVVHCSEYLKNCCRDLWISPKWITGLMDKPTSNNIKRS